MKFARRYINSRIKKNDDERDDVTKYTDYIMNKKIPSLFQNSGVMINGKVITAKHLPDKHTNNNPLSKFMEKDDSLIANEFLGSNEEYDEKWAPTRSAKKIKRTTTESYEYTWSEGKMAPFDDINRPARTIITSEGGGSASRIEEAPRIEEEGLKQASKRRRVV